MGRLSVEGAVNGLGHSGAMDHEDLQSYLSGADYPATTEHLIDVALGNRAPDEFVDRLRGLGEHNFDDLDDVGGHLPS